jgi:hypothetical protein
VLSVSAVLDLAPLRTSSSHCYRAALVMAQHQCHALSGPAVLPVRPRRDRDGASPAAGHLMPSLLHPFDCRLVGRDVLGAGVRSQRVRPLEVGGAVPQTAVIRALACCYISGC